MRNEFLKSRSVLITRIAILAAFVVFFSVGIRAYVVNVESGACGIEVKSSLQSPNSQMVAVLTEKSCDYGPYGGTYYFISIHEKGKTGKSAEIFTTDLTDPSISWTDDGHLLITVNRIGWIGTSLHGVDGVEISYRLGSQLSDDAIQQEAATRYRNILTEIRRRQTTLLSSESALNSLEFTKKVDRQNFETFKKWARSNIPGAYAY